MPKPKTGEPQQLTRGGASIDALITVLEARGLGWSLDHTGGVFEARVWDWPHVVARYRSDTLQPLAQMLAGAMAEVDWRRYPLQAGQPVTDDSGSVQSTNHEANPCSEEAIRRAWLAYHGPVRTENEDSFTPQMPPVFKRGFVDGFRHAENQIRQAVRSHGDAEIWGENGVIAAFMLCGGRQTK